MATNQHRLYEQVVCDHCRQRYEQVVCDNYGRRYVPEAEGQEQSQRDYRDQRDLKQAPLMPRSQHASRKEPTSQHPGVRLESEKKKRVSDDEEEGEDNEDDLFDNIEPYDGDGVSDEGEEVDGGTCATESDDEGEENDEGAKVMPMPRKPSRKRSSRRWIAKLGLLLWDTLGVAIIFGICSAIATHNTTKPTGSWLRDPQFNSSNAKPVAFGDLPGYPSQETRQPETLKEGDRHAREDTHQSRTRDADDPSQSSADCKVDLFNGLELVLRELVDDCAVTEVFSGLMTLSELVVKNTAATHSLGQTVHAMSRNRLYSVFDQVKDTAERLASLLDDCKSQVGRQSVLVNMTTTRYGWCAQDLNMPLNRAWPAVQGQVMSIIGHLTSIANAKDELVTLVMAGFHHISMKDVINVLETELAKPEWSGDAKVKLRNLMSDSANSLDNLREHLQQLSMKERLQSERLMLLANAAQEVLARAIKNEGYAMCLETFADSKGQLLNTIQDLRSTCLRSSGDYARHLRPRRTAK